MLQDAPAHMLPALGLMMFMALAPKDALVLPKGSYKDGEIGTRRSKTGEPVFWECPAPLKAILDQAPAHDAITLCANSDGKPWTVSGFRASWRPLKLRLELARADARRRHWHGPARYCGAAEGAWRALNDANTNWIVDGDKPQRR